MYYSDNEEGMRAARAVSQWHIGDRSWADAILDAYFNPERAMKNLALEKQND